MDQLNLFVVQVKQCKCTQTSLSLSVNENRVCPRTQLDWLCPSGHVPSSVQVQAGLSSLNWLSFTLVWLEFQSLPSFPPVTVTLCLFCWVEFTLHSYSAVYHSTTWGKLPIATGKKKNSSKNLTLFSSCCAYSLADKLSCSSFNTNFFSTMTMKPDGSIPVKN